MLKSQDNIIDISNNILSIKTYNELNKYIENISLEQNYGFGSNDINILKTYNFNLIKRTDAKIRMIYCGILCDEENTLEIIEEFIKFYSDRDEVNLKFVYGSIEGNKEFTQKINKFINDGVKGITFKHNLTHKDMCYEVATSDIGICWSKNSSVINGDVFIKENVYEFYGLQLCRNELFFKSVQYTNIAVIVDEFTYKTIIDLPAIKIYQIDKTNIYHIFDTNYIKFFFCESAWCGKDNKWKGSVYQSTSFKPDSIKDLLLIIKYCNKHNIKTIFCNKEDPAHYEDRIHDFVKTSMLFDKIYTTSIDCIKRYKNDYNRDVYLFYFCYNPILFNPININKSISDKITFFGSWYSYFPQRCKDMENIFENIINNKQNLIVYDRYYNGNDSNHFYPDKYKSFINKNVSVNDVAYIMKQYKYSLTINSVKDCESMFARRIHEINACNVLCLSNYNKGINKLFFNTVPFIENKDIYKTTIEMSNKKYNLLKLINLHKSFKYTNKQIFSDLFEISYITKIKKYIIIDNIDQDNDEFNVFEYIKIQNISDINLNNNNYTFITKFPQNDNIINAYISHYEYIKNEYILCVQNDNEKNYTFDDNHIIDTKNQYIIPPNYVLNKNNIYVYYIPDICLLNIIVPCYNAENKYKNLIRSLSKIKLNTIFFNIIFVDDNSKDNTFKLLQRSGLRNKILIKLNNNSGSPSKPRNIGIKLSNSTLITLIDIDDEIIPEMICEEYIIEFIDKEYDIIRFPLLKRLYENTLFKDLILTNNIDETGNICNNLIRQQSTTVDGFYNLFFLKKNNIYFNESIKMSEDTLFIMEIYNKTTRIQYINKPIYIYNTFIQDNENLSSTQKYEDKEIIDHLNVILLMENINPKWYYLRMPIFIKCMIKSIIFLCRTIKEDTFNIMKETYIKYLKNIHLNLIERYLNIINIILNGTYTEFLEIIKPNLLISGYDFKFINELVDTSLKSQYTIKYDKWEGHDLKSFNLKNENNNELKSNIKWADIIFCEWMLSNSVYYSNFKNNWQKLFIRCHRFELTKQNYKNINIKNVNKIICVSPYYSRLCEEITNFNKDKIITISNFVNTKEYEYSNEIYYTIGIVGILPVRKNLLNALEILNTVNQIFPNIKLNIYGKQYFELNWLNKDEITIQYFNNCKKYINDNNLNVCYMGFQDLKKTLKNNDFILSISEKEKFGESFHISPAEGFLCGCVSLFTNWNGVDEIYPKDYIFQDIKEISDYIINFYKYNLNKEFINKSGYNHIKNNYDIEIITRKLENLFRN